MTTLAAGPCRRCKTPLPERAVSVGAAFCDLCRQAVIAEEDTTSLAWEKLEQERWIHPAARYEDALAKVLQERRDARRERKASRPMDSLKAYLTAADKPCNECGKTFHGMKLTHYCPPCAATILAKEAAGLVEAKRREALDLDAARIVWANLPSSGAAKIWSSLELRSDVPGLVHARAHALRWVAGYGAPWLVLVGGNGLGKSHIAEAAIRDLVAQGKRARWEPVVSLLQGLRRCYDRGESADDLLETVAATPWLVLDDLGRERGTDWVRERLYWLVNERSTKHLRTLVTTNEGLVSIGATLGRATAERVYDTGSGLTEIVTLTGESWRVR